MLSIGVGRRAGFRNPARLGRVFGMMIGPLLTRHRSRVPFKGRGVMDKRCHGY